ncbi:hypothetical protein RHSIM_Rhsim01G0091700 [Rhododendron simsii]|uniref:Non-haem dioxygenase N-terminal domain-containing protein n=1 Tax=Rhododendron simsii TaxID=118357 RepID=A0A834M2B1_RHOSS|nr:hypothetical protein RHSIM_Rhsim01G0091700 [Rhododendron simsii]
MSCYCQSATPTIRTVTIPYSHLKDKNVDLSAKIQEGFGPNGLGILSISDVPGYSSLRQNLLRLSPRLASLPEDVKKELEDPNSRYNFGWSHGKEKLESGKPDVLKGSFYANPILDRPTTDMALVQRYPAYCGSNIWPDRALPELEVEFSYLYIAFKALGKLILDVGLMVAYHSDKYVSRGMKMHEDEGLEQILNRSRCHKGRLLYYFPSIQSDRDNLLPCIYTEDCGSMSSWCGWHTDHGSLTGESDFSALYRDNCLTCGMFMKDAVEIPCPDSAAGLYIKTRTDQIVKVYFLCLQLLSCYDFALIDIHGLGGTSAAWAKEMEASSVGPGFANFLEASRRGGASDFTAPMTVPGGTSAAGPTEAMSVGGYCLEGGRDGGGALPPTDVASNAPAVEVPPDAVIGAAKSEAPPLREASEKLAKPGPTDDASSSTWQRFLLKSLLPICILFFVEVVFGEDEIAYQIGETTEILSRGHLCATPHCVRLDPFQAPKGKDVSGVDRSTFALFMQPDWDEKLNFPEVVHIHQELIAAHGSLTFGEYTEKLLDKYYHLKTKAPTA